jgi:hypothetical protein
MYVHTYRHTYVHTFTYTCACTLMRTHTHTHKSDKLSECIPFSLDMILWNETYQVPCSKYWMQYLFAHQELLLPKCSHHSNFSCVLLSNRKQIRSSNSQHPHRHLPSCTESFHHHLFQPENIICIFF